jgi:predicted dehydrogenase
MFSHFIDCVKNNKIPIITGEDGKAILKMIFAAYKSAKEGKKVKLPFKSYAAAKPIDLWIS